MIVINCHYVGGNYIKERPLAIGAYPLSTMAVYNLQHSYILNFSQSKRILAGLKINEDGKVSAEILLHSDAGGIKFNLNQFMTFLEREREIFDYFTMKTTQFHLDISNGNVSLVVKSRSAKSAFLVFQQTDPENGTTRVCLGESSVVQLFKTQHLIYTYVQHIANNIPEIESFLEEYYKQKKEGFDYKLYAYKSTSNFNFLQLLEELECGISLEPKKFLP